MKQTRNQLVLGLLAFGMAMRVLPYVLARFDLISLTDLSSYAWNVSPIPAMCLLGGAYFTSARFGFGIGFAAYLFCDVLIGLVMGQSRFAFYPSLPFVYAGVLLYGVFGLTLRSKKSPIRIATVAFTSEVVFFLVSNFGVWVTGESHYSFTISGLMECYVAAIPFCRNSVLGMCLYVPVLFGLCALFERQLSGAGIQDQELELARARQF